MRCGGPSRDVLVAVFPLASGRVACLQMQDEGDLRRGGVYLAPADDPECEAIAPRFDELFADAAHKVAGDSALRAVLVDLLERARDVARGCVPRLSPESLAALTDLGREANAIEEHAPAQAGFAWEELVVCVVLIFVSEEERYPRPRYKGGDLALQRFLDVL